MLAPHIVAKRLAITRDTVYRWLKAGRFPNAVRLSPRCWRIPASDVDALVGRTA